MAFMFEKLEVYQKAVSFADEIASLTEGFRRGYYFLADQVPLLEVARRRGLLDEAKQTILRNELEAIARMLSGLISGLDKRRS